MSPVRKRTRSRGNTRENAPADWPAVTGRCLAYLCLKNSDHSDTSLLKQAAFLEKLGLPLEDRAGVLGSTTASLQELARRARLKKGVKKSAKARRRR